MSNVIFIFSVWNCDFEHLKPISRYYKYSKNQLKAENFIHLYLRCPDLDSDHVHECSGNFDYFLHFECCFLYSSFEPKLAHFPSHQIDELFFFLVVGWEGLLFWRFFWYSVLSTLVLAGSCLKRLKIDFQFFSGLQLCFFSWCLRDPFSINPITLSNNFQYLMFGYVADKN